MTFAGPGYPGDFDGDGDVDLIVALLQNGSFVSMRSLWNTGGGGYTDGGDAGPAGVDFRVQPGGDWSPAASVVGDSDGDGDLDLFTRTATGSTHTSRLWLNDGAGHFVFRQDFTERVEFVGDLGGSYYGNYPDIFTTAAGGAIHFGQGVNTWMPPGGGVFFGSSPDGQSHRFVFRDLDNDGDIDLSFINQDGGYHASAMVRYQGGAGAGWYGSEVLTTTDYWAAPMSNVQLADFNGDGWDDLLSSAPEFALTAIAISLRNPTGIGFQAPILQTVYPEVNGVVQFVYGVSADIDGDGDADYLTDVWIPNLTFDGEEDGCRVQIGTGWADAHGMTPTLGAQGPFRVGLPADLRVTGAPGATSGLFTAATVPPGSVPVFPGTGLQQAQRLRITNLIPFTTSGSSAEPGSGSWMLSFTVPGYHAGRTVHYTAEIFDPTAPAGSVRTNDLRITYGP
jgi:hypothetical protein